GQFFSAESTGVGIAANGSSTATGNGIGWNTAGTVGYYTTGSHGALIYNNAQQFSIQVLTSPALICHALDLTNNKYWVRAGVSGAWNNSASANNPATNVGGYAIPADVLLGGVVPAFTLYDLGNPNDTVTAAFAQSSWKAQAPAGFGPFDPPAPGVINWAGNT